jgi:hypothetical protein
MLPITSLPLIPPVAAARVKMGQMSNHSSDCRELRILGSFRSFAHREAVGSFRNSLASVLRLQSSANKLTFCGIYSTGETGLRVAAVGEIHETSHI